MKTTKQILKTAYFDGFVISLRDKSEINKKWYSQEEMDKAIKDAIDNG